MTVELSRSKVKRNQRRIQNNDMNNTYMDMFNYQFIQQQAQVHHCSQVLEIQKCAKSLRDFLDGLERIDLNYQNAANAEFCAIILDYFRKHR